MCREPTTASSRSRCTRLGIVKGQPFAPDERMTRILEEAARIGNGRLRVESFAGADALVDLYFGPQAPDGAEGR